MLLAWKHRSRLLRPGSSLALAVLLALFALLPAYGCRNRAEPSGVEAEAIAQSEPDEYSATIVRTVHDGSARDVSTSRIARSGEMRREEWSEQGGARALISRPDMNKVFLLDLDKKVYVELALGSAAARQAETDSSNANRSPSTARDDESASQQRVDPDQLERAFSDAPLPANVTTRALPDQTIDNQPCKVFEQRASFNDGHVEITRVFYATQLHDLAIRIESQSEGGLMVITERRDVKTNVLPGEFIVPVGFKKVEKLAH